MQIKAIGKYGRYAPFGEVNNCYLIKTINKNIIIDFGAGSLAELQKHIEIKDIDCIILTHLHFDHSSDIGVLSYAAGYLGLDKIKVYMPQSPKNMVDVYLSSKFEVEYIEDKKTINIDDVQITFCKSPHPVETYALKIIQNGKVLVYTSDCSDCEVIEENTFGADYVIGDACILDKDKKVNAPHISVKELAENVPVGAKLYLAHLTAGAEDEILNEARLYHKNAEIVKDFEI